MEFNDPIISIARKGTSDSPFQSIEESLIVDSSAKVQLTEYPHRYNRVIVTGDSKDWYETDSTMPDENSYHVDYLHKIVTFNIANIGKQLQFKYEGVGTSLISAKNIYTERNGLEVVDTLQTLTDTTKEARDSANQTNENIQQAENVRVQNENTRQAEHTAAMNEVDQTITTANNRIDEVVEDTNTMIADTSYIEPYNATTTYKRNNVVSFNGHSFIAKQGTKGNPPPDPEVANENAYWGLAARKGADGTGTVKTPVDTFTATEGQRVFNLRYTYDQFQGRTKVTVGGVPQFTPEHYEETTSKSITLNEGVPAGTIVKVEYFSESVPLQSDIQNTVDNHTGVISDHASRLNNHDSELNNVTAQLAQNEQKIENTNISLIDVRNRVPEDFGSIALAEHPLANNPILTKNDVTDKVAKFVADPFYCYESGLYHMFFEVAEQTENGDLGSIGHATSVDGVKWTYNKIILTGGGHWAYPYVFKLDGEWYMLPDRGGSVPGLTLYRATNFPEVWEPDAQLFATEQHMDATPIYWNGKWYMIDYNINGVNLYYADSIKSTNWTTHPSSPILTGSQIRPGGRPIIAENHIDIFIQDGSSGVYGEKLFMHRITELTETTFAMEKIEKPIIQATNNGLWNSRGMHNLDLQFTNKGSLPLAVVDGRAHDYSWGIGIYTIGVNKPKPFYRALLSADQSIPSAAWTKVNFSNIQTDTAKGFDGLQGYVVSDGGYYSLTISVSAIFQNVTNPNFLINTRVLVNGVEVRTSPELGISTTGSLRQSYKFNDSIVLKKGDKVEVEFYQASGLATDIVTTGGATFFSLVKVD